MNTIIKVICLLGIILIVLYVNNSSAKESLEGAKLVTKIVDGDTIIIEDGAIIRFLGIDTDEKQYQCYQQAKKRLEELLLNKIVELKKDKEDKDQYGRSLRYVILNNENINIKMIKEGLAIARIEKDIIYKEDIIKAEEYAKNNRVGCKWKDLNNENKLILDKTKENLDNSIPVCDALNYIGQEKIVKGIITEAFKTKSGTLFLNIENKYPKQCLTIVIFKNKINELGYLQKNVGKQIIIRGEIKDYNGKPEIILNYNEQVIS